MKIRIERPSDHMTQPMLLIVIEGEHSYQFIASQPPKGPWEDIGGGTTIIAICSGVIALGEEPVVVPDVIEGRIESVLREHYPKRSFSYGYGRVVCSYLGEGRWQAGESEASARLDAPRWAPAWWLRRKYRDR